MTVALRHAAATDIGLARRTNEDAFLAEPPLFAVADGMGGHSAGDVASATAVEVLAREVKDAGEALAAAVKAANEAVHRQASSDPGLSGMGTTMTAMLAGPTSAQIVHVGDSRAYLLREGRLERLTRDHTVADRLAREGKIPAEDADRHPQRSILERALGVSPEVNVDVEVIDIRPDDRLLLCTDGLTSMLTDEEIREILEAEDVPERASKRLVEEAVRAGGNDNVTAVVVDYPAGEAPGIEGAGTGMAPAPPRPAGSDFWGRSAPAPAPPILSAPPRTGRRWLVMLAIVLVVLGAGAFAARWALSNSWYVGENDGMVTVFRGVPGSFAGIRFGTVERVTDIRTDSLPAVYQRRLEEGMTASDRDQAEGIVRDIRELRVAPSPFPSPSPGTSPSPAPVPGLSP